MKIKFVFGANLNNTIVLFRKRLSNRQRVADVGVGCGSIYDSFAQLHVELVALRMEHPRGGFSHLPPLHALLPSALLGRGSGGGGGGGCDEQQKCDAKWNSPEFHAIGARPQRGLQFGV